MILLMPLKQRQLFSIFSILIIIALFFISSCLTPSPSTVSKQQINKQQIKIQEKIAQELIEEKKPSMYPLHKDITVTIFWVGEGASEENEFISNEASAWDDTCAEHAKNENPFYFALPYNDFNSEGKRKEEAYDIIYWANEKKQWPNDESMLKNRWIKQTAPPKISK